MIVLYNAMSARKGKAKMRFILSLGIQSSRAEKAFELCAAVRESIGAGIQDNDDVVSRKQPRFAQAPTLPDQSPRPVPRNRIGIGADWNKNCPIDRKGIRNDVYSHSPAGKSGSSAEDLLDLGAFSDPLFFGKALPGYLGASSPEGLFSTASSRRRR